MFTDLLENYLKDKNSDYAIVLDGEWGSGKTYFVKDIIQRNFVVSSEYDVVYVSLFGTSSIEDFYRRIFWSIHNKANKVLNRSAAGRMLSCFDFGMNLGLLSFQLKNGNASAEIRTGAIDVSVDGDITNKKTEELIKLVCGAQNRLYVFDDIERISFGNVNVAEIFGAITNLIDEDKAKVLLVCNEEKLSKGKEEYFAYKEKFVRATYCFNPIIEYKGIDNVYNSFTLDCSFLGSKKNSVLEVFHRSPVHNLRTLHFVVYVLDFLYKKLQQFPEWKPSASQIIDHILTFVVIYVVEYKDGKFKNQFVDLAELPNLSSRIAVFNNEQKLSESDKYYRGLAEKYRDVLPNYHFLKSVAVFIETGELIEDLFESEISEIFETCVAHQAEDDVFQTLMSYYTVQEDKFKSALSRVTNYIKDGRYQIDKLLKLYRLKLRFGENYLLPYNKDDIVCAIKNQKDKSPYIQDFDRKFKKESGDSTYATCYNEMLSIARSVNDSNEINWRRGEEEDFYQKITENKVNELYEDFQKRPKILYGKDLDRIFNSLEKADNKTAFCIMSFFDDNYNPSCNEPYNSSVVDDDKLCSLLEDYIKKHPNELRVFAMKELLERLKNAPVKILARD